MDQTTQRKLPIVILAGGENSRFFPLNYQTHKGAFELAGKPLMIHTLSSLQAHGFQEFIVVVSPKDTKEGALVSLLHQHGYQDCTVVVQANPTGMGDAVLLASQAVGNRAFAIISPYHCQAGSVITALEQLHAEDALCVTHTSRPWEYGIVTVQDNMVSDITEKPPQGTEPSSYKVSSVYKVSPEFVSVLQKQEKSHYSFEAALKTYLKTKKIPAHIMAESLPSLKYAWDLFSFSEALLAQMSSSIDPSAQVAQTAVIDQSHGPVVISKGARVGDFAKVVGPCFIGEKALVGDYSFVRESCVENGATVGANTEVVRSIIGPESSLHFGYLADSILGRKVKIGGGILTANKRLDRAPIQVTFKDKKIDSGLKALGCIAGDGAQLGIRVNTMPGVCIGAKAQVFPGMTVWKSVDAEEVIKNDN